MTEQHCDCDDFASWARMFSQRTNQSLAGANLLVDENDGKSDRNALLKNQAECWGMNVIEVSDKARTEDRGEADALPINSSGKAFAYRYIPQSCDHNDAKTSENAVIADMREATGREAMDYAQKHMPVTHELMRRLTGRGTTDDDTATISRYRGNQRGDAQVHDSPAPIDFNGIRIAICLILEPKTAVLLRELKAAGAQVGVCCEPGGVDERVAKQLRTEGITVEAKNDWTSEQYHDGALRLLDALNPNIIIDDGASFARLAARERPDIVAKLIGVAEETTSGVRAFQAMQDDHALPYPVVAVNDSPLKTCFDNAHGTGETCVTTIQEILGAQWFTGKRIAVVGYGPVGRGFALRIRALGAQVTICDIDPTACLKAVFEGFPTQDINEAVSDADMTVSATGVRHTLAIEHLRAMKTNATVTVIGGIADEIALDEIPTFKHHPECDVTTIEVPDGPTLRLLAQGDGVNYTAGGGNPIEIMDLSFAVQVSAVAHLIKHQGKLPHELIQLDKQTNREIANIALQLRGYHVSHTVKDNGYSWETTRFDAMRD
ncbi:adenosylhomocysteinase [Bifidobacterium commune]|uniref:Adenosylhomocysteinase n=1 Tax=Bifidobacterium commune TaxID=1505727 RepID=A0A1C4H4I5_9BIFI|nr:adenosylhomocysteinase [Bifidobacterium commune]SCC79703.1 adenosylhomocysteinase [Bifidobacterium commune]